MAALRIISLRRAAAPRARRDAASRGSARPDERVAVIDRDEVGVDRRREGRVGELHRVIDGVLFRGPLPRGAYLNVAGHHAQVRRLLVVGGFGRKEAYLDVEQERLDGAGVRAIFGAGEGANLSHGDLLLLFPSPRPSRP